LDVPADERPVDPEEFYDHQLVGLSARTCDGSPVGEVTEVLHLPGQDVLAVRTPGGQTALVPFVRELVPTIEIEARHLTVTEKAGLLPAEDSGIPSADGNGTGPRT
jgi:16S rRNA processing protein RimM